MAEKITMIGQYRKIKEQYPDAILFFRLGDFYEMFFDDAKLASRELELALTGKNCGEEERAPMCGVPFHSYESYVARLVAKGYKVAICEQMEDPKTTKGLVDRGIVRVITPGTVLEGSMLDEDKNNYLAIMTFDPKENATGLCFCDCSTGDIHMTVVDGQNAQQRLISELGRFSPSEMLVDESLINSTFVSVYRQRNLHTIVDTLAFADEYVCREEVCAQFGVATPAELGIEPRPVCIRALGGLLQYLKQTQMTGLERLRKPEFYRDAEFMRLDLATRRNLELLETMRAKEKQGSLLGVLDRTRTAMGKRLMRAWIEQPLIQTAPIFRRLDAVDELVQNSLMRSDIREYLTPVYDLERIITRIVYGNANARELRSLQQTLDCMPSILDALAESRSEALQEIRRDIDPLDGLRHKLAAAIEESPPFTVREGGMIRKGYNAQLDEFHELCENGAAVVTRMEAEEKEKTGIKTLHIKYNRVFGYYVEVSKLFENQVPDYYVRKQTTVNTERYITPELKELENRILTARESATALEYELFCRLRQEAADQLEAIQRTANAVARLDVFCSFAEVSEKRHYCRPVVDLNGQIHIVGGRHPVVESIHSDPFVPNDTHLDDADNRIAVITGPNMAGKSTYMRQTALIVLMAQIGCFVPAKEATIGIVDSIFTRVGASDDLAAGQSTFMVEMSEVAYILQNATAKSLIVFDEIGRGTSTYDGMSIARAVLEYVADPKTLGAKTLFATHYHELTVMENELSCVKNYNIAVKKRGDDITFLRRIVRGPADDSYGIEVAKLAGINDRVVKRAKEILQNVTENGQTAPVGHVPAEAPDDDRISLFDAGENPVIRQLQSLDVNVLTPIEALQTLHDLVQKASAY